VQRDALGVSTTDRIPRVRTGRLRGKKKKTYKIEEVEAYSVEKCKRNLEGEGEREREIEREIDR
jgi:hypothetical protein